MYLGGTSWVNSLLGFLALRIGRLFRRDILFFLLFVVVDEIVIIFVVGHGCGEDSSRDMDMGGRNSMEMWKRGWILDGGFCVVDLLCFWGALLSGAGPHIFLVEF